MGTQKNIAAANIDNKADYILALKRVTTTIWKKIWKAWVSEWNRIQRMK
jgi:hypothetical protein